MAKRRVPQGNEEADNGDGAENQKPKRKRSTQQELPLTMLTHHWNFACVMPHKLAT